MPTYTVDFYNFNPGGVIPTGTGSTFIWTGPSTADGTATITDNEAGIEGLTLDDDSAGGETATADVTVGGNTSIGSDVDAELVWTLRDTVTGLTFEVIQFDVENGAAAGDYLLSEVPLVSGRTYEVVAYDSNPNVTTGDPAFSSEDYTDLEVSGTTGDDTIDGSYADDPEGDVADGGDGTGPTGNEDTIFANAGNDSVVAGLEDDLVYGGSGNDTILGGAGNDTIWGDSDPQEGGTVGGSNTVGSSFTVISLGSAADVDPTETNTASENAADLIGTYGGAGDELYRNILDAQTFDTDGSGAVNDDDNGATPENIVIDGVTYQIDSGLVYDATVTFTDGSSGAFTAVVIQTTTGEIFMVPELTNNADNALLTSQPIESISLNAVNNDAALIGANRLDADYAVGPGLPGNDSIDGGEGDDEIYGEGGDDTLLGGSGADTIVGDSDAIIRIQGSASLNWSAQGADESSVAGGFTQSTGDIDVTVTYTDDGGGTGFTIESTDTIYTEAGEPFNPTSSAALAGDGTTTDTSTVTIDFDSTNSDVRDEVVNVSFRLDEIDQGGWRDIITINAFDAFGNPVDVTITPAGADTVSGNTITAADGGSSLPDPEGSALVEIAGPVSQIAIIYQNGGTAGQVANISDIHFDTISLIDAAGNDSIDGGADDDVIYANGGNDTIIGGLGADMIFGGLGDDEMYLAQGDSADGGAGDDLFVLSDLGEAGAGTIDIVGGETGEIAGDTLQLTPDVTFADITFTNTDDANGGLSGNFTMGDGTVVIFSEIENIICFTPGTRILTIHGERPIETLRPGDMVVTRDSGPKPIRWIGHRTVPGRGKFAPIAVNSTVMDGARRPLLVSPQHRILFTDYKAQLLFGESEVLVAAKHLVDGRDVRVMEREKVTYFHMMLDRHEVVYAEGAATESFHAGDVGLEALSDPSREEMFAIFPELRASPWSYGPTARICLKPHEARLVAAMQPQLDHAA
ncbi:Hint domain-containing protein [Roseovarius aestuariivivens]|uniref:Hint domain-containing protein n=1 Tax=Roseovarius aestuariivivens TaxID=1888910 RepID=UPI0010814FC1|nr:Hint domain-containing protein [Roseovarius aestuariivivens]